MSISKALNRNVTSQNTVEKRLQMQCLIGATQILAPSTGSDVVKGLTQTSKSLPPSYFYDDRGSELFELICDLPEYYLTRTETTILQQYASEIAKITGACELVELGSGNSTKTRILLDAYQQLDYPLHYLPIDVCAGILESSAKQLLRDYPLLQIYALAATYELALAKLLPTQLPSRMICFIGSSLGNLTPNECDVFFSQITEALQVGEYFLLGIDLRKPKQILEPAYNDSQGVTAAFNLNILEHLNQQFEGNFDTTQFEHWAFYNENEHQIEMHLRSLRSQNVELRALNLKVNFALGETILTEISRKFDLNIIKQQLTAQGLLPLQVWTDPNQWFGLLLCQLQA
ncbi:MULTISPECIES: L-histidine N(alpha)-methyltransferase [unclassified Nostoc]|uniref:L-histidine N(alpha)-methyltransferase n=1 Tax=unclassified Nostoc TaxID=2593658 RepID=UPI002AD21166|nr:MULTISPECIES: L-histidine N(alpha)-methyltransferase [unclassified Nostoc]MDZ8125776.1 L-histidine N(alpha)-methyltransferase [Nostoc sp. CmiVER01]MDZ8224301.1 L-histidine N(alpha)-methyltransferase [Nostoc sp. ChiVER01]